MISPAGNVEDASPIKQLDLLVKLTVAVPRVFSIDLLSRLPKMRFGEAHA